MGEGCIRRTLDRPVNDSMPTPLFFLCVTPVTGSMAMHCSLLVGVCTRRSLFLFLLITQTRIYA